MASLKHEILKYTLNIFSTPMMLKLPRANHLRSILETTTMFATLPWGVTFEMHDFGDFKAECLNVIGSKADRVILYLHGGGYVIGSPKTHRSIAGNISKGTNLNALVIDYRKAPEHPFPAALDDTVNAYKFLLDQKKYDPRNIILIGDSAGGGLVVALQYYLKDHGIPLPRASVLLSPYLDLKQKGKSVMKNAKNDRFLDVFEMRKWARYYAPEQDLENPLISPLYGDPTGLPPMLIQVSESEVLFDDARRMASKAKKSGVDVTFQTWKGLVHWWHLFGTLPEAKEAIDKIIEYINRQFEEEGAVDSRQ
jgi:acetyl esterase/lipase